MRCIYTLAGVAALTVATPKFEEEARTILSARAIEDASSSKTIFMSKELRQAYINQDVIALANYSSNTQRDYDKLTRTMFDAELPPFNRVTLDGKEFHFYGDENSYVWSTVLHAEGPEPEEVDLDTASEPDSSPEVVHKATIEIGHYSASGGQASSFAVSVPRVAADSVLALGVFTIVQRSLSNYLHGRAPRTVWLIEKEKDLARIQKLADNRVKSGIGPDSLNRAIKEVADARVAAAIEASDTTAITRFLARFSGIVGGVIGFMVMLGITLLFDTFLVPLMLRDYFVKVNIVNLDKRSWTINSWHGDNAIIPGGDGNFTKATLPPPSGRTVPFHPELQADLLEATDVSYTFQNSNNFFEGLGVALQASLSRDNNTGFMIGYDCPFAKDNKLAFKAGKTESPEDWYDNGRTWSGTKRLSINETLEVDGEQLKLRAVTDSLWGKEDHFYNVWVTIGSIPP